MKKRLVIIFLISVLLLSCFSVLPVKALTLNDGLVLYLPFNEGSGNVASDKSGYNNHCIIYGEYVWVPDSLGYFINFTGNWGLGQDLGNTYGIINNPIALNLMDNFTFETRTYYHGGRLQTIFCNWLDNTHKSYIMCIWNGNLTFVGSSDGTSTQYTISNFVPITDNYYDFALVFNNASGMIKFYVNGTNVNNVIYSYNTLKAQNNFQVGRIYTGSWSLISPIDCIRIYNRVLSDSEILALYNLNPLVNQDIINLQSNITSLTTQNQLLSDNQDLLFALGIVVLMCGLSLFVVFSSKRNKK